MANVTIDLSEEDFLLAQENAKTQGYSGVEAYVQAVLERRLREEIEPEQGESILPPKDQLKALILEGLASSSRERTQADFDRVRQEIIDRHRKSRAG